MLIADATLAGVCLHQIMRMSLNQVWATWTAAVAATLISMLPAPAAAQATASPYTSGYRWDADSRLVGMIAPDPDGPSGPLPFPATRYTYDDDDQLTKVETGALTAWQSDNVLPQNWAGFTVYKTVVTTFDAAGNKIEQRTLGNDSSVQLVTQMSYDEDDRPDCTAQRMNLAAIPTLPSSYSKTFACVQSATAGSFGPDRITQTIYDAAGRVQQIRKGVATSAPNLEQAYVTYSYTPNGKQADLIDANGNHALLTWDDFDRQQTWQFPSATAPTAFDPSTPATALATAGAVNAGDFESYGYDASGNRTSLRKRDGRTFTYMFDALNRVTEKIVPDACVDGYVCTPPPASAVRDVYYSYDLRGLQTDAAFDSATGADSVASAYDPPGRLVSSTTAMSGTSRSLAFIYDADGDRIRVTHPDSSYFVYGYDFDDRLQSILENGGPVVASTSYNADGTKLGATRGAVSTGYGYDHVQRLSSLFDDLSGATADVTTTLAYSPASQISGSTRDNDAYAYVSRINTDRTYFPNGLNQYAQVKFPYSYDSNGNLISDSRNGYTYDAENRLIASAYTHNATLVYDALGRLWQTASGGVATQFLYDGDQLTLEYAASGAVLRRYVHGTGDDDPQLWYEGSGLGDRRSLQADWQGSIVSVANAGGASLGIDSYDEYGSPSATNIGRFQYTGQAWLPEAGLYYYKARIYSPALGRFLQVDPVGYDDQNNLYAYVANDPVNGTDPDGRRIKLVGSESYRREVLREMRQIQSGPNGNAMVHGLIVSKNEVVVRQTADQPKVDGDSRYVGSNHTTSDAAESGNGKGTGSTVYFDPKTTGGVDVNGSNQRPSFVGLGHELGQAEANDRGDHVVTYPTQPTPGTTPAIEQNAMTRENQIRDEHNLPPRTTFFPPAQCSQGPGKCQ